MAKGDSVVIGDGYAWKAEDAKGNVPVYKLVLNENGEPQETPDGGRVIQVAGGVKVGSTGVVQGKPVKVQRAYLQESKEYTASMANDMVELVPVLLDQYQQIGWFPIDHTRII